uniref:TEA domain-containing protein n=1 Tax=Macrostomum lignano TaxID=282301 RepID=A0A1I8F556_9PLAT
MQAAQSGWPAAVAAAASSAPSAATTSVTMETRDNYSEGNGRAIMKVEEDDIDEEEADDPQQRRDQDPDDDAEGVWSQDIEQSFQRGLAMSQRADSTLHIRLRTGKTRTRKQVSSHIQVLARRRTKEVQSNIRDPATKERAMQTLSHQQQQQQRRVCPDRRHLFASLTAASADAAPPPLECVDVLPTNFPERRGGLRDFLESGPDGAAYLVKFWADINTPIPDEAGAFYGFGTTILFAHFFRLKYESTERLTLSCSTKVVLIRPQARVWPLRISKAIESPMCEYMLPEKYMMNTVLENFTIL